METKAKWSYWKHFELRWTNSCKVSFLETYMIFLFGQPKQDFEIIPSHGTADTLCFLDPKKRIILTYLPYFLKYTLTHLSNFRTHILVINLISKYMLKSQEMWPWLEMSPTCNMKSLFVFLLFMRHFWNIPQNWVENIRGELINLGKLVGEKKTLRRECNPLACTIGQSSFLHA